MPARRIVTLAVLAWAGLLVAAMPPDALRPAALDPITLGARAALRTAGVRTDLTLFQGDGLVELWPDGICPLIVGYRGDAAERLNSCHRPAIHLSTDGLDEALTVATEVMSRALARGRPDEAEILGALVADHHCRPDLDRVLVGGRLSFQRLDTGATEERVQTYMLWDCRTSERLPRPWLTP